MGTLTKVRFRLAWQNYRVGDVIQPTGTLRGWLLANGYVEPVVEAAPPPIPVTDTPAAVPARTRKRVHP